MIPPSPIDIEPWKPAINRFSNSSRSSKFNRSQKMSNGSRKEGENSFQSKRPSALKTLVDSPNIDKGSSGAFSSPLNNPNDRDESYGKSVNSSNRGSHKGRDANNKFHLEVLNLDQESADS